MILATSCAAEPGLALPGDGLRWQRGDEWIFQGEILESSDSLDNRFRKKYSLELALFVFDVRNTGSDVALMTVIRSIPDPTIAKAVVQVSGRPATDTVAMDRVRLDLLRVSPRGQVRWLQPKVELPIDLAKAEERAMPVLPLDLPMPTEIGMFITMPVSKIDVGQRWSDPDGTRPPLDRVIREETSLFSRRSLAIHSEQTTPYFDKPQHAERSWKRTDDLIYSLIDGLALKVRREVIRRHGAAQIGSLVTEYQWKEVNRYVASRLDSQRRFLEQAWLAQEQLQLSIQKPGSLNRTEFHDAAMKWKRHLTDHPEGGVFRQSLESTVRRSESIARGEVPYVSSRVTIEINTSARPRVGTFVPEFVVADVDRPENNFRLRHSDQKPAVLLFFKPGSATSPDALQLAESLHHHYAERASVIPLAIAAEPVLASDQRAKSKLKVPIWDGRELRGKYHVETFPQVFVVDATGRLRWHFDAGVGPEIGYLTKVQLEKCFSEPLQKGGK